MRKIDAFWVIIILSLFCSCGDDEPTQNNKEWQRLGSGPVFRDIIPDANYEAASDPHVFFDNDELKMIYTGDSDGRPAIKLASGNSWEEWKISKTLLGETGPSGIDVNKETSYYRESESGKHQIYYIGYEDESSYEAQIFLAESDMLEGPYIQMSRPVISKGMIAGQEVYCMTSPSVVEHDGLLYITFIGWDKPLEEVTEVWIIGATSSDQGITWSDFQIVDTRIGMEGQVTKIAENEFVSVRTGDDEGEAAIFYASASHPFGPWSELQEPILIRAGGKYEKDEVIAPQITVDPSSGDEFLFYTGADYQTGWWIMLATQN